MKARSKKIERIVKVAESDERRYAEMTGAAQRQLNSQKDRLGELSRYRTEYSERAGSTRPTNAAQLKDYQTFLDRLDTAVVSQKQVIQECERSLDAHRRRWQAKRQRLDSLQKVAERLSNEDRQLADRQAQRIVDDRPATKPRFSSDG